ncbi:MAG: O-antigen ligase family protein [bacterium]|nr:O-antigen ligase family protein [bacterium]
MRITLFFASVTLAALPLYAIRCSSLGWCVSVVPFTLLEALIALTFISWLVWRVSSVKKGTVDSRQLFQRLRRPFFWPLLVFLAVATISLALSPDLRAAAGIWKAYFIEPALLYLVVLDLSLTRRSVNWVFGPLLFSGVWLAALAVWQAKTGVDPFAPTSINIGRVTGVYDNPNALGLYLGPLALIGLGFLLDNLRNKKLLIWQKTALSVLIIVSLCLYILAIYFSKSRGAALGIGISGLFFAILLIYRLVPGWLKKAGQILFYSTIGSLILITLVSFANIDKFVSRAEPKSTDTAYTRLCIWQATKKMLVARPVFGSGLSGFPKVYPKYATCEGYPSQYPHNIFLNFWTELGLFGLLTFLWIIYKYWRVLIGQPNNFIAIGLLSVVVYIFVHGLVDVPYFKNDLSSEFWVMLAVAASLQVLAKET